MPSMEELVLMAPMNTGNVTTSGRPMWSEGGQPYSERSVTFPLFGKWMTFPAVGPNGQIMPEDQVAEYVRANGPVDPITGEKFPTFETQDEAERYARMRSKTR